MNKRGISPLIATVLIIGFTVALAAVIMTWGQSFTKGVQEQTEETSTQQITCAQDVMFDLQSVCRSGSDYTLTIANNGNKDILRFRVRFYEDVDTVNTGVAFSAGTITVPGLTAFDIDSDNVGGGSSAIKKVEIIPIIGIEGKEITCSSNVDSFGDLEGSAIDTC